MSDNTKGTHPLPLFKLSSTLTNTHHLFFLQYLQLYSLLFQTTLVIHHPFHTTSTYHVVLCTVHCHSLSCFQLVYQKGVFTRSLGSMS